jgi:hypothetical protein
LFWIDFPGYLSVQTQLSRRSPGVTELRLCWPRKEISKREPAKAIDVSEDPEIIA